MIEIQGKFGEAKIFTDNEIEKLISLIEQEVLSDKGGKDV